MDTDTPLEPRPPRNLQLDNVDMNDVQEMLYEQMLSIRMRDNKLKRQHDELVQQDETIARQQAQIAEQANRIADLETRLAAADDARETSGEAEKHDEATVVTAQPDVAASKENRATKTRRRP